MANTTKKYVSLTRLSDFLNNLKTLFATKTEVDAKADATHSHTVANITDLTATATELNHMDGVTSNVQTQLNGKQATITGGATTIATSNLTANRALISNGSGKVAVSAVTSTELGYLDGVTSNVQTQLNGKVPTSRTINSKALSSNITLSASDVGAYAKTEIDNMEFVTVDDIDTICGASIQVASLSNEVTF